MSAVRPTEYSFDASSASNRSGPNVALNRGSFVECSDDLHSVAELGISTGDIWAKDKCSSMSWRCKAGCDMCMKLEA